MGRYKAKNGLSIPDGKGGEKRVEAGEMVELTPGQYDALRDSVERVETPKPRRVDRGTDL